MQIFHGDRSAIIVNCERAVFGANRQIMLIAKFIQTANAPFGEEFCRAKNKVVYLSTVNNRKVCECVLS